MRCSVLPDTMMELGDRLSAGNVTACGSPEPVGLAVSLDEVVKAHPVDVGSGVVLSEARFTLDLERRRVPER